MINSAKIYYNLQLSIAGAYIFHLKKFSLQFPAAIISAAITKTDVVY